MRSLANKLLFFAFVFNFSQMLSQNIAVQSFETSGDTWIPASFSTPPCSNNNDIWNYVTSLSSISPSDGSRFWGIRDLNGNCGGNGYETITFPNVLINGTNDVVFSFDYNAIGFDNNEDLKYELFYDNISQGEVIVVNGVNNNTDDTNGWKTEIVNIPNSVNNVSVTLSAKCNQHNDRAGFDNVKLATVAATIDNCNGAAPLTVYAQGASNGNETSATTVGATASSMSNTSCDSFTSNQNIDLFYTFTVPAGQTSINVITGGAAGGDINVAVWDNCNGSELYCSNVNSTDHQITGLTPNTTYILQVWHDSFNTGAFTIALETPGPPPSNNDCANPTTLTVGSNNTQNVVIGTNVDATDSGASPIPSCANYSGNDVWYEAQIPSSGILIVETSNSGPNIDTAIGVYSGTCTNLTEIDCDDDSGSPLYYSKLTLTGLPNTTVKIRVWTWNNFSQGNFTIVAYSPDCLGTTTWRNGGWSNGAPNSSTSAIINRNYDTAINGNFETCNLQINNNRTVNIRANNHITINNDLNITGTLIVHNNGTLLMTDDDATVTGTATVYRDSNPLKAKDYNFWSSPVLNQTIGNAFPASPTNYMFEYIASNHDGTNDSGWKAINTSTIMTPGVSYLLGAPTTGSFPQTQTAIFDGTVNNGLITTSVLDNPSNENWNLVGNPYPSAMNANDFLNHPQNSNLDATIYFWTHNTAYVNNVGGNDYSSDDYATYTANVGGTAASTGGARPLGDIASGQGFYVHANQAGNAVFNNSMRINNNNNQFFRDSPTKSKSATKGIDRIWLNMENDNGAFSQILIGFIEKASDNIDRLDGANLSAGYLSMYSIIENENFKVNAKSALKQEEIIPLGFDSYLDKNEEIKIKIDKVEGILDGENYDVILYDKTLNIKHNLKVSDYSFLSEEKGTYNNRFELIIIKGGSTALSVDELSINKNLIIYNDNEELQIYMANNDPISNLKVFDMQGRLIYTAKEALVKHHIDTKAISNGSVLIVQAALENNIKVNKKTILYK